MHDFTPVASLIGGILICLTGGTLRSASDALVT